MTAPLQSWVWSSLAVSTGPSWCTLRLETSSGSPPSTLAPLTVILLLVPVPRSLEGGPDLSSPSSLCLSREGVVVASYPSHHLAVFTVNGKRLRDQLHSDNIQVRQSTLEIYVNMIKFVNRLLQMWHWCNAFQCNVDSGQINLYSDVISEACCAHRAGCSL